jgi:hypothetical protein
MSLTVAKDAVEAQLAKTLTKVVVLPTEQRRKRLEEKGSLQAKLSKSKEIQAS